MGEVSGNAVRAERLRRQGLAAPVSIDGYAALFAALQPVEPVANTRPGDPPRLVSRTRFDDAQEADRLRARRAMVKGRFQGGRLAYVLTSDLALYANAFCRPLPQLTERHRFVLDTLRERGPLTPRQLKEETGLLNKEAMPILHRLQQAFLVFEDQTDSDWERGWYDFAAEWPAVAVEPAGAAAAVAEVLHRFLRSLVFGRLEHLRDWSGLGERAVRAALADLERRGAAVRQTLPELGEGWLLAADTGLPEVAVPPATHMLHLADPLVRAHAGELKASFGGHEVLQYLLIDGVFAGAVVGHWRIGPHDVEDVVVDLPPEAQLRRREEILAAVAAVYHPPQHCILRYAGEPLAG